MVAVADRGSADDRGATDFGLEAGLAAATFESCADGDDPTASEILLALASDVLEDVGEPFAHGNATAMTMGSAAVAQIRTPATRLVGGVTRVVATHSRPSQYDMGLLRSAARLTR